MARCRRFVVHTERCGERQAGQSATRIFIALSMVAESSLGCSAPKSNSNVCDGMIIVPGGDTFNDLLLKTEKVVDGILQYIKSTRSVYVESWDDVDGGNISNVLRARI